MGRLEGRRAVITGGASGIGEATVRLFVAEGASVVVADIDDERGRSVAAACGDRARFVRTDVTSEDDVDAAVATAVDAFGGLDCMFNNAGNPGSPGGIEDVDMAVFDRTVAIHLRGVFLGIRAAARVMRPQGQGSIVNTASVAALAANYAGHDYSRVQGGHRPPDEDHGQRARRARHPRQRHLSGRHRHPHLRPGRRPRG